jgi:hypothetical protein
VKYLAVIEITADTELTEDQKLKLLIALEDAANETSFLHWNNLSVESRDFRIYESK